MQIVIEFSDSEIAKIKARRGENWAGYVLRDLRNMLDEKFNEWEKTQGEIA